MLTIPLSVAVIMSMSTAEPLSAEEVAAVRNAVYDGKLQTYSPDRDLLSPKRLLHLPKGLAELYKKNPDQVLDLLIRIADGGNPADSIRAICYAYELKVGPGHGAAWSHDMEYKTHDVVAEGDKRSTREIYVLVLRAKLAKK